MNWNFPILDRFATATAVPADQVDSIEDAWSFFDRFTGSLEHWFHTELERLLLMVCGFLLTLLVAALVNYLSRKLLVEQMSKWTKNQLKDGLIDKTRAPVSLLIVLIGFSGSFHLLHVSAFFGKWVPKLFYAGFVLAVLWGLTRAIGVLDLHFRSSPHNRDLHMNKMLVSLLRRVSKILIWLLALIFICQNVFDLNVTALLTGAGIAGIAIAFAAQNTIANLFGAVSLIWDKAFKIGDRIACDGISGSVESLGLRSTRLRSLDGTLWDVPNRILADNKVENVTERPFIKYAFTLGLTYSTAPEQMERALEILGGILDNHPAFDMKKQPPQYFFTNYNASSLDVAVTLWFQTTDYLQFQKWKQEINLAILRQFNRAGLEFAFPSVTNYLVKS